MRETFFKIRNVGSKDTRMGRLVNVSIDIARGECLALAGHTYSGTRELYAILSKNSDYTGSILLQGGKELRSCSSGFEAGALCIDQRVLHSMGQKTLLYSLSTISGKGRLFAMVNDRATETRFEALLERLDYHDCDWTLKDSFSELSRFAQMQFALLRCLYASVGCILLENPFRGLREDEIERLVRLLAKIKAHGIALIYIVDEHNRSMEKLIDRVAVFYHGAISYVFYPKPANPRFDFQKIETAAGGNTEERKGVVMAPKADQSLILNVQNGEKNYQFWTGERVGIYDREMKFPADYKGLARYLKDCRIELDGEVLSLHGMKDFLDHAVVLARKDPTRELFFNLSPVENVTMLSGPGISRIFSRRRIERYMYREVCEHYTYLHSCLDIINKKNCYGLNRTDLKGLVVAKWLSLHPRVVLFFDHEDTYQPREQQQSNELASQLSQEGILVITVSPNRDFLEKTCDRIIT